MWDSVMSLAKRINVPITAAISKADYAEMQRDPWSKSGKYGRGFVYFALVLLAITTAIRFYHIWGDKMRVALYREDQPSTTVFQSPSNPASHGTRQDQSVISKIIPLNNAVALMRWIFYRPLPVLKIGRLEILFPSLAVSAIVLVALIFVTLYCFIPQPLYFWSVALGSPPLAIRAGMLAVAMVPWIVALSTKANFISILTGLGPDRLNGLHRWSSYLCLFLSLVHTVPFYVTPIWEDGALINYRPMLLQHMYVYGTGVAALVPLLVLCIHSLPFLRHRMYELFIVVHIPVSFIFVGMLFWHTKNYLSSWGYLWSTIVIWIVSYIIRLFYLNWSNPFLPKSFMIGEKSSLTLLPKGAVNVTIPTRMRWRPGQYVYLRLPHIAFTESHPFTIASLCSDDFPSAYGKKYRDMTLVFRPFKGFTRKAFHTALKHGPYRTYTALLEGPYGGMKREMAAFDDVIFFAGGSGITAIASQLLDLIKKIRDGKAVTKSVRVIWALKNVETMEWFQEELRICRDNAPSSIVNVHFFLTGVKKEDRASRDMTQEKIYNLLQGIDQHDSAGLHDEAAGEVDMEKDLQRKNGEGLTVLPKAYTASHIVANSRMHPQPMMYPYGYVASPGYAYHAPMPFAPGFGPTHIPPPPPLSPQHSMPQRPVAPQYASYQSPSSQTTDNWRTDYFRPDIPQMLTKFSQNFGRRTCVFVCGPPSMRVEVANTVAKLQLKVLTDSSKDEIFLHAENYDI